jgi:hypothetical protein
MSDDEAWPGPLGTRAVGMGLAVLLIALCVYIAVI